MNIISSLDTRLKLKPQFADILSAAFEEEFFKKGSVIWRQDNRCNRLFIVKTGLLRVFYYDAKGREITHWFAGESTALTDLNSFFHKKLSVYNMESLEDTVAYTITLGRLNALFDKYHEIERFGRLFTMEMMMQVTEKVKDLQFRSAEERYRILMEKHPSVIQRAPLGKIASYLGITQQSLSRISEKR
jgi:CRP/FNR family transcriptional regulator, anaerobic regulatory protein